MARQPKKLAEEMAAHAAHAEQLFNDTSYRRYGQPKLGGTKGAEKFKLAQFALRFHKIHYELSTPKRHYRELSRQFPPDGPQIQEMWDSEIEAAHLELTKPKRSRTDGPARSY